MNKVITINLNGKAYQIEEDGYALLQSYLQEVRSSLSNNPDKEEITKDFEQAIAEKCNKYISGHKNVIGTTEIKTIINEMGPVDHSEESTSSTQKNDIPKRLYRIREGAWIAGVANGIAAYFGIDVKIVRGIFILLTLFTHGGIIALYVLMAIFIPAADTTEERAFARGRQFNTQEFIEEMKAKYGKYAGKYAEDGYWKKYADMHTKGFNNAWLNFSRIGTGIFTFIGTLALIAISICYSIMMWSVLVDHRMLGNKFLVGASPILLALFITACVYIVVLPIRKMVNEARRHTWNMQTNKKHRGGKIVSAILWFIAIGFAVTVGIQSIPDNRQTYVPYGTDFWINHHYICIGGNYFCDPSSALDDQNKNAVEKTVHDFGETLQQVSLLAPASVLKPEMQKVYGPYITPALLVQWQNHPDEALGRRTSSPYPDHISIDDVIKNEDGTYTVKGEIIETTNNPQDDVMITDPVVLTLIQTDAVWYINTAKISR